MKFMSGTKGIGRFFPRSGFVQQYNALRKSRARCITIFLL